MLALTEHEYYEREPSDYDYWIKHEDYFSYFSFINWRYNSNVYDIVGITKINFCLRIGFVF